MNIKGIIYAATITCYHNMHTYICIAIILLNWKLEINNEIKKPFSFAYGKHLMKISQIPQDL